MITPDRELNPPSFYNDEPMYSEDELELIKKAENILRHFQNEYQRAQLTDFKPFLGADILKERNIFECRRKAVRMDKYVDYLKNKLKN